jgi:hypothetical protein
MTDTSGILSSLDRFIERFARHGELISDQRVATQNEPMGTTNSLTNNGTNQSGHSGHAKQETFAGVDHERCGSHPSPAEISGAGLARKVSSVDGYSGKNGKYVSYQQLAGSHRENVDGHSGKSFSDQQFASHRTDTGVNPDAKLARLPMLPGWTRQSGATYMRNAPRIGSLMGAIHASRQNCWPGGISNGDGISHTASGPRLRYVRDAVSAFYRTRPST